jgi:hypothetical protein
MRITTANKNDSQINYYLITICWHVVKKRKLPHCYTSRLEYFIAHSNTYKYFVNHATIFFYGKQNNIVEQNMDFMTSIIEELLDFCFINDLQNLNQC